MLAEVERILVELGLVQVDWHHGVEVAGDEVAQARAYFSGEHDTFLTAEMQRMLRSRKGFEDNYCELVVNTMVDRLLLTGVSSGDARLDVWAGEMMRRERFDALQLDVHQAVVRDGDAFVMVSYDNVGGVVQLTLEEAWDNVEGVIPVYDRSRRSLVAVVKVWFETTARRVNIYYPDRLSRYRVVEQDVGEGDRATGLSIVPVEVDVPWGAGVIPFVHFKNRAGARSVRGRSELRSAIPLQDVLNRTLISMIMTSENSAFQIRYAVGFDPPTQLAPGSWVTISPEAPLGPDERVETGTYAQGEMVPFIEQANFLIRQIATVTATPLPDVMGGAGESGEALKERQTQLTGKVLRAQVRLGNSWEDLMGLAVVVRNAFHQELLPVGIWDARWRDAQMRNEVQMREAAKQMREAGYEQEFLRIMGTFLGYDADKVAALLIERREEQAAAAAALGGSLPGFEQFLAG